MNKSNECKEILLLIPRMAGGGAERVIGILADAFANAGYDTTLMITNQKLNEMVGYEVSGKVAVVSMLDMLEKETDKMKYFLMKQYTRIWGTISETLHLPIAEKLAHDTFLWQYHQYCECLRQYLIEHPKTEVVAFLQPTVNIALLASEGLPNKVIISERADPARYQLNRYMPYFADKWYPKADMIVFQSESAQAYFQKEIIEKSTVIYNPLNPKLPKPYLGERRKTIVNFCRLTSQKNLPLLIDAFELFHQDYPEYILEIWGEGEAEGDVRNYIAQKKLEDVIVLKPFDATLHEKIKDCTMFVSSSDYEGMSNSMLEALAIGIPTICTDCPAGGAKAIIQDYENGLLTPVGNVQALYKAMKKVVDAPELADKLSRNGAKLRDELSVDAIIQKWIDVL